MNIRKKNSGEPDFDAAESDRDILFRRLSNLLHVIMPNLKQKNVYRIFLQDKTKILTGFETEDPSPTVL